MLLMSGSFCKETKLFLFIAVVAELFGANSRGTNPNAAAVKKRRDFS